MSYHKRWYREFFLSESKTRGGQFSLVLTSHKSKDAKIVLLYNVKNSKALLLRVGGVDAN